MLKAAVVGGPSLVFTGKHVAGETRIRSHKYDLARIMKRILGFDSNSLYPSNMAKEMPCGKEFVEHYEDPVQAAKELIPRMYSKRWFGFAEVGVLKAKKVLLYAPLLAWYYENGLEITAVHRTIDYIPQKIFEWFVKEVANMRRKGKG